MRKEPPTSRLLVIKQKKWGFIGRWQGRVVGVNLDSQFHEKKKKKEKRKKKKPEQPIRAHRKGNGYKKDNKRNENLLEDI